MRVCQKSYARLQVHQLNGCEPRLKTDEPKTSLKDLVKNARKPLPCLKSKRWGQTRDAKTERRGHTRVPNSTCKVETRISKFKMQGPPPQSRSRIMAHTFTQVLRGKSLQPWCLRSKCREQILYHKESTAPRSELRSKVFRKFVPVNRELSKTLEGVL